MAESESVQAGLSSEMQSQAPPPPTHVIVNRQLPNASAQPLAHPSPAHSNLTQQSHVNQSLPLPPPPPRNSAPEGNRGYQIQEAAPTENYRAVPGGYPEHNDLAYGSEHRSRRERHHRKERNESAFDQGVALIGKLKKRAQVNEPGDSRADTGQKGRGSHETRLRTERDYYRGECAQLSARVNQLEDANRRLVADLEQERDRVARTLRSANQMQSTMDNRDFFLGHQASDDTVCTTFLALMNDVKNWSRAFTNTSANSLPAVDRFQDFQIVTPMYGTIHDLENSTREKKQKGFFVRGWTAYVMRTKLFRSLEAIPVGSFGQDAWLEKTMAHTFRFLEDQLWLADRKVVPYKSFNDWRAFTAELLGKAAPVHNGKPNDQPSAVVVAGAVADVMNVVNVWHKTGTPEHVAADAQKLHGIFTSAVQFAQLLRRQRALWSIRYPLQPESEASQPLRFNPALMEDERNNDEVSMEELRKCCVEFVVTPALYKRGTMNGELFDKEEAVCRAAVVMAGLN